MRIFKKILVSILKVAIGLIFCIPFIWMLSNSVKTSLEIQMNPLALPKKINFSNYIFAWESANFDKYMVNSIIIIFFALVILVFVSSLAAYAFARFNFPYKNVILLSVLIGLIIPQIILIGPIYRFFENVGLINNRIGLIILYVSFGIPFSVYILRSYFLALPKDLEDAAVIDGCSRWSTFFRIILPISKSAISTVLIFNFVGFWNEFIFAYTLTNSEGLKTVSAGLGNFIGRYTLERSGLFAAATITTIPILIIFLVFQRYFVEALAGSVKE